LFQKLKRYRDETREQWLLSNTSRVQSCKGNFPPLKNTVKKNMLTLLSTMNKRLITLLAILIFPLLFNSCGEQNIILIRIYAEAQRILNYERYEYAEDSLCITETILPENGIAQIRYDSLRIQVTNETKIVLNTIKIPFGIESAYAFEVEENYELITDIAITSNQDYSNDYPAGTNLNDILTISSEYYQWPSIDDYLNNQIDLFGTLYFTFKVPPTTNQVHEITIRYTTEKNRIFAATVSNLLITK